MGVHVLDVAGKIDELLALDDEQFKAEVDRDLRRWTKEPDEDPEGARQYQLRRAALRSPELVDRWFTVLLMAARSVDGQIAALQEDHEAEKADLRRRIAEAEKRHDARAVFRLRDDWERAKVRFSRVRASKLRFKTGLDEWVIEARALRDRTRNSMYDQIVTEERNYYASEAQKFKNAIRDHQAQILGDDGIEPSPADEKLWQILS